MSLLFCGITLKHYAYFNMSRRTQLTTKYLFQVLAQLSENFIFIYLGLSLFTEKNLVYQPLLIIVTVLSVCVARWMAVFPLSKLINWFIRYRARRAGREEADELPYNYQAMLFWAGLRGAVGVALAALFTAKEKYALMATVLVVVVLTVIIFGGTTARMLEIMEIRTGVVDEIDSDDEFDIEAITGGGYIKRTGTGLGYTSRTRGPALALDDVGPGRGAGRNDEDRSGWASGHRPPNPAGRPVKGTRKTSKGPDEFERSELLGSSSNTTDSEFGSDIDTSDLPPAAPRRRSSPMPGGSLANTRGPVADEGGHGRSGEVFSQPLTATGAFRQLFTSEDPSALFRQLDEDFIKPTLLLDPGSGGRGGGGGGSGAGH